MPKPTRCSIATACLALLALSACGGGTAPAAAVSAHPTQGGCAQATTDAYARAVLADHPAVYYRLIEAAGPMLCDASPSHNDWTYAAGGVTYAQPGALHYPGATAISVDGTGRPEVSRSDTTISGSTDFTLEGWFRTAARQDQMVVDIGQPSGYQKMAGIGPWSNLLSSTNISSPGTADYICFDTYGGAFQFDASSAGIDVFDGHWHYVAVSFSAKTGVATVYLDKHTLGSTGVPEQLAVSPVRVGFWVDTLYNHLFNGGLAEIAVYPSALSADQLARHYTAAG